jgi:hypothetical protein
MVCLDGVDFGLMDLDLRAQIEILCLNDLKPLGFGFGPNPSRILKDPDLNFRICRIPIFFRFYTILLHKVYSGFLPFFFLGLQ